MNEKEMQSLKILVKGYFFLTLIFLALMIFVFILGDYILYQRDSKNLVLAIVDSDGNIEVMQTISNVFYEMFIEYLFMISMVLITWIVVIIIVKKSKKKEKQKEMI